MANPFVWGPSPIYFGPLAGGAGSAQFVGFTDDNGPQVEISPEYENLMCSISGSRIPFDKSFQGERASITINLTRWNQSPIDAISQFASANFNLTGGGLANPGFNAPGDVGTLMQTEGEAISLFLIAPYTAKSFYATQMPGMRFLCCIPGSMRMGPLGTKPRMLTMTFEAWPYFEINVTNGFGTGALVLWDAAVAGVPGIN